MIASGESGTDDQGDPPTETGPAAHRRQRPREGKSGSLMALRNPARATPARAGRKDGCTWQGTAGNGASPDGRPRSVGSRGTWCQPPALGTGGRLVSLSVTSTAAEARLCAGPCGCSRRDPILADVLETVGKVAGPAPQRSSSPSSKFGHGHERAFAGRLSSLHRRRSCRGAPLLRLRPAWLSPLPWCPTYRLNRCVPTPVYAEVFSSRPQVWRALWRTSVAPTLRVAVFRR